MNDAHRAQERFEDHRSHLRSVAYRILGSVPDADDAVQEAWIRVQRSEPDGVENIGGWLTTVVSRVCLDMLRSRRARREASDTFDARERDDRADDPDPQREAVLSESIGLALLVVMDTLSPAERLAFVLHDMFAVPFRDIATVLDATPDAARQYASRARRRVRGGTAGTAPAGARHQDIVGAFLAASRNGEFETLVAMLHPDAALRVDALARQSGVEEVVGARRVAGMFAGRARAAELATIDGHPGVVWRQRGAPRAAFRFTIVADRITDIELVMDPDTIGRSEIVVPLARTPIVDEPALGSVTDR